MVDGDFYRSGRWSVGDPLHFVLGTELGATQPRRWRREF
jgi:hypothetical protein